MRTNEEGAGHGGDGGVGGEVGQEGRKLLPQGMKAGEGQTGRQRVPGKGIPQKAPGQQITGDVHQRAGDGGGEPKPVLKEQRHAQHTSLGDVGALMDVVEPEGQDARAQ